MFSQKSKFWAEFAILVKKEISVKNGNFGQKSKFW